MSQTAAIRSLPQAFEIIKEMRADGYGWGEDYRGAVRGYRFSVWIPLRLLQSAVRPVGLIGSNESRFSLLPGEIRKLLAQNYRRGFTHGDEVSKTHYQLQKIPEELPNLRSELQKVQRLLDHRPSGSVAPKNVNR